MESNELLENRIKALKNSINLNRVAFDSSKTKYLEYAEKELEQKQIISDLLTDTKVTNIKIENLKTKTKIHIDLKGKITELLNKINLKNVAIGASSAAVVLGGLTISASAGALPGDPLYSLKLSMEKVQVALTLNKQDSLRLQVDITGKRIEELSKIVANKNTNTNQTVVNGLVNKIENDLVSIPSKVSSSVDNSNDKTKELASAANMVDDKITEYNNKLQETKKVAESNGLDSISNDIDNIGIKGNHISVKTLNIVVQNINSNNLDEKTKQDIVDRVGKKIDNIKEIVATENVDNITPDSSYGYGYGYGEGGAGSNLIAQLDDMKEQLNNIKVGSASIDELSLLMKDIDKKLSDTNLVIVNANDKLNDSLKNAIDLNKPAPTVEKQDNSYGYGYGYGYGEEEKKEPEVKAESLIEYGYGNVNSDMLWSPDEDK